PSGPSDGDTSVRTVSLLPTAGEAAAQGWTITGGSVALEDGVFKVTKQSNKTWSLMHPVDDAVSLLTLGLNALTLTDITKNAAYGVEIESLVLEINAP
ncbi:TPA: hypothetical protein QHU98_005295, partial [Escherichia coli]|nr:hypothetical protein [Escherichia coli]